MATHPAWFAPHRYKSAGAAETISVNNTVSGMNEIPSGGTADQVLTKDTATDYDVSWQTPSGGGGGGDMSAATYDPGTIAADAFSMGNMVETVTKKILTDAERTKLTGIETAATADQTNAEIETAYNAQVSQASQGEMQAGTVTSDRRVTPQRVKQAVEYMYPIWAEENAALGNNLYEWAFGNGAGTPSNAGITIYVPTGWEAHIVAMSATTNNASGSSVIEANINGTLQGANCNVTISGRSGTNDTFTPVSLSNGDRLTFRTTTAGTNSGPSTVTAWIRMRLS